MKRLLLSLLGVLAIAGTARAGLDVGEKAPNFTAPAVLGGRPFDFSLAATLAKGPVVLYFFPAAFSEGCSIEAHEFAEAAEQYRALGATVIGVSGDDIDTLGKFSQSACQGKFPVASDEKMAVIKAYDAAMSTRPEYANRISYVIAPGGSIVYSFISLNPHKHVERTLDALRAWQQANAKR